MNEKKEKYETIPLRKVKKMLGYAGKGYRAVTAWCKKNGILIFGEGQQKRILESDWIKAQLKAVKKAARLADPIIKKRMAEEGLLSPAAPSKVKYRPKTKAAKNFLKGIE